MSTTRWAAGCLAMMVGIGWTALVWRRPLDVVPPAWRRRLRTLPLPPLAADDDAMVTARLAWQRRLDALAVGPVLACIVEMIISLTHAGDAFAASWLWLGLSLVFAALCHLSAPLLARRIRGRRATAPLRRRTLRTYLSPWLLGAEVLVSLAAAVSLAVVLSQRHDTIGVALCVLQGVLLGVLWLAQRAILRMPAGASTAPGLVWDEFLRSTAIGAVAQSLLLTPVLLGMSITLDIPGHGGAVNKMLGLGQVLVMLTGMLSLRDSDAQRVQQVYAMLAGPPPTGPQQVAG